MLNLLTSKDRSVARGGSVEDINPCSAMLMLMSVVIDNNDVTSDTVLDDEYLGSS